MKHFLDFKKKLQGMEYISITLWIWFVVVTIVAEGKFTPRCDVKDSMKINPKMPRSPSSGFQFQSSIDARLMSRLKTHQDKNAFTALFDSKMQCREDYFIPVSWHILHSSDGTGNVTMEILDKQINVLNDAFRSTSLFFKVTSTHYIINNDWTKACIAKSSTYMSKLAVSPSTTLNLYTCLFSSGFTTLGSATMPWWFSEESGYHGVLIHTGTLPGGGLAPINEGKNAVHEVGHYFGLFHVFEGECNGADDKVDDTPRNKPSYGCPSDKTDTCQDQPGKDPIHNYMGYTDDACMYEFTPGQIKRMKWAMEKYRPTLMRTVKYPCTFDAVFRWSDGHIYIFSGYNYYRYNEYKTGLDPDYPRPISTNWEGVPDNIDGAFRYANGITYFFKGKYYYRYNDITNRVDPGFPRLISDYWRGIPSDIDDVISSANSYTYFFKGSQYYRFNPRTMNVDLGYPRNITDYWTGIPNDIEAAIPWYNGGVYFFKDAQYWLFLHGEGYIGVSKGYPKPVRKWWNDKIQLSGYSVFRHFDGNTYFMRDNQYWRYNDNLFHVDFQYPKQVTQSWQGINTVLTWNGNLYIFKGNHFYRFNTSGTLGDPKAIGEFWKGVPVDVNAAFRYVNGITYFFKGSHYYRFNDTTTQVESGYPRAIASFWRGVPDNIDSVFVWSNGHTYFFKGNLYYRFNCNASRVDPGYPKSVFRWRGVLYRP